MTESPTRPLPELPAWPVVALFVGYPLWWLLGLGTFAVSLLAVPMLVLLVQRGQVRMPRGFVLWWLFVLWACAAAVEVEGGSRLIGFAVRLSSYLGATTLFLYLFNASDRTLPVRRVLLAVAAFFGFVVLGGWLGVLFPHGHVTTPLGLLLPDGLAANSYVHDLLHPAFAEVQQPYGSPRSFSRPSAPFPYTNGWGCNVSLLVPLMAAALARCGRGRLRTLLVALLLAALVPAFATLNRGMFLAIGVALVYAAVRLAVRGRVVPLVGLVLVVVAGLGLATATGVVASLQERLHYSQTNVGRQTIYEESFQGALASPLLGNGSPKPSETLGISIGTQGQIWNVMYSYGFPALAFFVGWFALAAWSTRAARDATSLWVHVSLVVATLTVLYYGYDGPQLALVMVAAAIGTRPPDTTTAAPVPAPGAAVVG